jgi:hypothetical protein
MAAPAGTSRRRRRVGGGAFTPQSPAGLVAWYDFSDATKLFTDAGTTPVSADADPIYQANDKSGHAYHMIQATAAKRPLYKVNVQNGKSVARFATDDLLGPYGGAITPTAGITAFIVWAAAGNHSGYVIDSNADVGTGVTFQTRADGTGHYWSALPGAADKLVSKAYGTTFQLTAMTYDLTDLNDYDAGGAPNTFSTAGTMTSDILLIGNSVNELSPFSGDIAEILIYNTAMLKSNLNGVGRYLATKWGFTWAVVV